MEELESNKPTPSAYGRDKGQTWEQKQMMAKKKHARMKEYVQEIRDQRRQESEGGHAAVRRRVDTPTFETTSFAAAASQRLTNRWNRPPEPLPGMRCPVAASRTVASSRCPAAHRLVAGPPCGGSEWWGRRRSGGVAVEVVGSGRIHIELFRTMRNPVRCSRF